MTVGNRIAEERKRLGHSQAKFAELVNVSLSSQKRYESGERDPDTGYLEQLRRNDVDTSYVITGVRKESRKIQDADNMIDLGLATSALLDISPAELKEVIKKTSLITESPQYRDIPVSKVNESVDIFNEFFLINVNELIKEKIKQRNRATPHASVNLDSKLLAIILERVENCQAKYSLKITPEKKANATVMLYRSFGTSENIDAAMIEDTVKLAAS